MGKNAQKRQMLRQERGLRPQEGEGNRYAPQVYMAENNTAIALAFIRRGKPGEYAILSDAFDYDAAALVIDSTDGKTVPVSCYTGDYSPEANAWVVNFFTFTFEILSATHTAVVGEEKHAGTKLCVMAKRNPNKQERMEAFIHLVEEVLLTSSS